MEELFSCQPTSCANFCFKCFPAECAHIIIKIRDMLCDVCFASSFSNPGFLAVLHVLTPVGWIRRMDSEETVL